MSSGAKSAQKSDEAAGWKYTSADGGAAADEPKTPGKATKNDDILEWTASEFIAYDKGFVWYTLLFLVLAGLSTGIYFITHDIFSAVGIFAFCVIIGIAAGRKPRVLNYRLDRSGITAGARFYSFADFKSFALINEGPFWSIVFLPMKRFALPLSLYLAPEQEAVVAKAVGRSLPLEQGKLGAVEQLMRRVRF